MKALERFKAYEHKTFGDAATRYLDEFDGISFDRQVYALRQVLPYIGDLKLIDVDDVELREYKRERLAKAMAGTVDKEICIVTTILSKAARVWRWIPLVPKFEYVKGPCKKPYPITWHEQAELFSRLKQDVMCICLFAVNTGVGREEIFRLEWWGERTVDGVSVFILRHPDTGHERAVVLNSIARRIVNKMRNSALDPEYVFPRRYVAKPIRDAWIDAGLPDDPYVKKGIDNLRNTFDMRLQFEGVSPEDRNTLLGRYQQSHSHKLSLAELQRLSDFVELITKPKEIPMDR